MIWDTITATAVTNPENFFWTYDGVEVITEPGDFQGQTVPLGDGASHIRFATGADYEAILELLFAVYQGYEGEADTDMVITELAGTWEGFTGNFHITFNLEPECRLNQVCKKPMRRLFCCRNAFKRAVLLLRSAQSAVSLITTGIKPTIELASGKSILSKLNSIVFSR